MNSANTLSILTAKLNPSGQQRLFEFLDVVDTDTAARFRDWLGGASETELGAAADLLNRARHGREFAGWWQRRDRPPAGGNVQQERLRAGSPPMARPYRAVPARSVRNAGIPLIIVGNVLMLVGRFAAGVGGEGAAVGLILAIVGLLVSVTGCMQYAEAKGHSKWVGLVGLLSCLGLLILLMLPDRYRGMR